MPYASPGWPSVRPFGLSPAAPGIACPAVAPSGVLELKLIPLAAPSPPAPPALRIVVAVPGPLMDSPASVAKLVVHAPSWLHRPERYPRPVAVMDPLTTSDAAC